MYINGVQQIMNILEATEYYFQLELHSRKTIKYLFTTLAKKDLYSLYHSLRISKYSCIIARCLGLDRKKIEEIQVASLLHDIGKIGISSDILMKPGKLTENEYQIITTHSLYGSDILKNLGFSNSIVNAVKYHHKRYDLKGYPKESKLQQLPLEASIIAVADAFDAMSVNRVYRHGISSKKAIQELIKHKGTQFHPYIVDIIVEIYNNTSPNIEKNIQEFCLFRKSLNYLYSTKLTSYKLY